MRITNFTPYKRQSAPNFKMRLTAHPELAQKLAEEISEGGSMDALRARPYSKFMAIYADAVRFFHMYFPKEARFKLGVSNLRENKCDLTIGTDPARSDYEVTLCDVEADKPWSEASRLETQAHFLAGRIIANNPSAYHERLKSMATHHDVEKSIYRKLENSGDDPLSVMYAFGFITKPKQ